MDSYIYESSLTASGRPTSAANAPPKGSGMQLGKSKKANQFLESLKAEGEVILEDVQPKAAQSRSAAMPLTDPITLTVEEKLNVTLKRDGGVSNFDLQGTLSLQILNADDAHIQVQVRTVHVSFNSVPLLLYAGRIVNHHLVIYSQAGQKSICNFVSLT